MSFTTDSGKEGGTPPATMAELISASLEEMVTDSGFAVIHDEPFITIVYENGLFWGTIVDPTPEKLKRADDIASGYSLRILAARPCGETLALRLTEVHGTD